MKPILFNTEMVKAILDNRKTVTRRPIKTAMPDWEFEELKNNPYETRIDRNGEIYPYKVNGLYAVFSEDYDIDFPMVKAPYKPGDVLYVRETRTSLVGSYLYEADQNDGIKNPGKWQPPIHTPKEAARMFLQVTEVRVQRLRDMTASQAMDEGFTDWNDAVRVWNSVIKAGDIGKYGWRANPWVWVISFERISKEEALGNEVN